MFYYGLDFHDLAPNFILNISVFIVVCEAFLRIRPHFSLWLKTFNVKPKVVGGQQAECGGAMVGKMPNIAARLQLGGGPQISIRNTHAVHLLENEGSVLGFFGRADRTLDLHPEHDEQENQARQRGPGYALPPDPSVPTTGICFVGVRLGLAPDTARALRHDTRGRLEGAVQGRRDASLPHRGPRTQRHTACQSGKFSDHHRCTFPSIFMGEV